MSIWSKVGNALLKPLAKVLAGHPELVKAIEDKAVDAATKAARKGIHEVTRRIK